MSSDELLMRLMPCWCSVCVVILMWNMGVADDSAGEVGLG